MIADNSRSEVVQRGTVQVSIVVQDINDEVPMFDQVLYTAEIAERTNITTSILRVNAEDRDLVDVCCNACLLVHCMESILSVCRHQIPC